MLWGRARVCALACVMHEHILTTTVPPCTRAHAKVAAFLAGLPVMFAPPSKKARRASPGLLFFEALAISFSTAQAAEHKTQIFFPLPIHGTHQTLLNGPPPSCPRALELQTTGSYERLPAEMPVVDRSC